MRYLSYVLTIFLAVALAAQTEGKPAVDFLAAAHLFDYDAKQPLDIHDKIIEEFDGGALHDITYTSPKGGPVAAYLIVPTGKGPFAAVLFGHWGNGTRAEFIPEAKLYARGGSVSLIPDYPWDRPQPWHKTVDHFDKPEIDRDIEIQAVVDLRRGIDVLLARSDVDPKRLAYVGHSYGAQWGSILSAVDRRMKTSVLMAGVAEMADILLRGADPGMVDFRKSQPVSISRNQKQLSTPCVINTLQANVGRSVEQDGFPAQVDVLHQPVIAVFQRLRIVQVVPGIVIENLLGIARGSNVVLH